jgi:hypothetical protein
LRVVGGVGCRDCGSTLIAASEFEPVCPACRISAFTDPDPAARTEGCSRVYDQVAVNRGFILYQISL